MFSRTDIIAVLGFMELPASELIKKLRKIEIIIPTQGKGKGKYVFQADWDK